MKKSDAVWILLVLLFSTLIIIPTTRIVFESLTQKHPYSMGFFKTAILASMGERLVHRLKKGSYFGDKGLVAKFIVWGLLGIVFVVIFKVFYNGVLAAQVAGLLPLFQHEGFIGLLLTAFLTSVFMNLFFAPSFMMFHQVTDNYIELGKGEIRQIIKVRFGDVIKRIDLSYFLRFIVLRTIPLFWIPAHTITFMLPENYRVLMAAYLSIALGFTLTFFKLKKGKAISKST